MRFQNRLLIGAASVFALATTTIAAIGPAVPTWAADNERDHTEQAAAAPDTIHLQLTPSSPRLASRMPYADVDVTVKLTTTKKGFHIIDVRPRPISPPPDHPIFFLPL